MKLFKIILFFLLLGCKYKTASDQNGNKFSYTKIGNQIWMSENLNVDKFKNGDPIYQAITNEEWVLSFKEERPAWCYYKNDSILGKKHGKIYNWYAIKDKRGLAPEGWHIPSDNEWKELQQFLGGKNYAGDKMKYNGSNSSGFGASFFISNRYKDGFFQNNYDFFYYCSSTERDGLEIWGWGLSVKSDELFRGNKDKGIGFIVRCVKD